MAGRQAQFCRGTGFTSNYFEKYTSTHQTPLLTNAPFKPSPSAVFCVLALVPSLVLSSSDPMFDTRNFFVGYYHD